jgi:hypothetical protein
MLIQVSCFWTLSIVLFLFTTHNVSETGFCLRLEVKLTQSRTIDRASNYLWSGTPENGDRTQCPKRSVLNKNSTLSIVQKHNMCYIAILSQYEKAVFTSYIRTFNRQWTELEPPLWSSAQSSWLQIQKSGFDSRRYQIF